MPKKQTDKKRPGAMGLDNHLPIEGQGRDEMIKIYAWSFEDAWDAQEEWENRYGPNIQGRGPFFRWAGAQELNELYDIHKDGNKQAVIEALYICSLNSLPLPRWCEMVFLSAYRQVRHYKAKSWDDVFGQPHVKGTHLEAKKEEREKSLRVYQRIKKIKQKNPDTPIDGHLFETVGKEFGTGGKTKTEQWYYKWKNKLKI
jgi:hypothetical protein